MKEQKVLDMLNRVGAVIKDSHVVYTSGKHGSAYVNKDAVYPHTRNTSSLCLALAMLFAEDKPEVVIAPAVGAIILSQWTAYHLTNLSSECQEVLAIYADKADSGEKDRATSSDGFVIGRGYEKLVSGKRVLVVEDVLTTGGSARKVVEAVRASGGYVIGVGALCNRGGVTILDLGGVPQLKALVNVTLEAHEPALCPLCKAGVPINTQVGKGKEYLATLRK